MTKRLQPESPMREALADTKSALQELRERRMAMEKQMARTMEQNALLETHRLEGRGAHGVFGLPRKPPT